MWDLLLTDGRVIDPENKMDEIADVAFKDGKVAAVGKSLDRGAATTVDATGRIVTAGLIDLHTHVYWGGTSLGIDPNT